MITNEEVISRQVEKAEIAPENVFDFGECY
jgi:hypothetical protein